MYYFKKKTEIKKIYPIIWWNISAVLIDVTIGPDIIISVRLDIPCRRLEPFMLNARMIRNNIQNDS